MHIVLIDTYYYLGLLNVNSTSFNKIYSLASEMWQFKNCQFEGQVASTVNQLPSVLAAVDWVINETIADGKIPLIIMSCTATFNLALKI